MDLSTFTFWLYYGQLPSFHCRVSQMLATTKLKEVTQRNALFENPRIKTLDCLWMSVRVVFSGTKQVYQFFCHCN